MANLEEERIAIERERLDWEKTKAKRESGFFNRHAGAIIGAIVSMTAVLASAYQSIHSSQQHTEELRLQTDLKVRELQTSEFEWKRRVAELFILHDKDIFASDQQTKNRFIHIFVATLPDDITKVILPELSSTLVTSAEDYSTIIDAVQSKGLPQGDQTALQTAVEQSVKPSALPSDQSKPMVYVHFQDKADAAFVDSLVNDLRQAGYRVPGKQLVVQATSGDIRYYKTLDAQAARELRDVVQPILGDRLKLGDDSLMDLSRTFPNLPRGILELWLPPLSKHNG
jgi:hypothetical protein